VDPDTVNLQQLKTQLTCRVDLAPGGKEIILEKAENTCPIDSFNLKAIPSPTWRSGWSDQ